MTTTPDIRALCAELLGAVDMLYKQSVTTPYSQTIELDGVLHPIPIGKDILAQDAIYAHLMDSARAALATPPPEPPTDEELLQTALDTRLYRFQATAGDPIQYELTEPQLFAFARAVLERWG